MPEERRLGRGLSDVSRLFLSSLERGGGHGDQAGRHPAGREAGSPEPAQPSDGVRIIGVASAAEGIQKSFLTINLAIELAKLDMRVVVLDADPSAPSVGFLMGVPPGRVVDKLQHADAGLESRCLQGPLGIVVVLVSDDPGRLGTKDRSSLLRELAGLQKDLTTVIINAPAVRPGRVCESWKVCTHLLVLTPPEVPGMMDAYRLIKAAAAVRACPYIGTVVTGTGTAVEGRAIYEKMDSVARRHLGISLINYGFVFDDVRVYESVYRQQPVALAYTDSISARCIKEIAEAVIGAGVSDEGAGSAGSGRWADPAEQPDEGVD